MKPGVLLGLCVAAALAACGGGSSGGDPGGGGDAPPPIAAGYDQAWEFDDAAGWTLTGTAPPQLANGRLLFDASVPANPNPFPPMFGCAGSVAEAAYGDATLAAGGYAEADFEFVQENEGTVTVTVTYAARRVSFFMPPQAGKVRLAWTGTTRAALYLDDVFVRDLAIDTTAAAAGMKIEVSACGGPNSPPRRSTLALDRVAIRAR